MQPNLEQPPAGVRNWDSLAVGGMLFIGLVVIGFTVSDYGIGWDEYSSSHYAELVAGYFLSGGRETACNEFYDLYFYGPTVDLVACGLYAEFPTIKYEIRHSVSAILALLILPVMYGIGRQVQLPRLGLIAGVILLLLPRFYGHAFINSKDIPFAFGFSWTILSLIQLLNEEKFDRWRRFLIFAFALGLTTSIRPGGWVLFGIMIPLIVAAKVFNKRRLLSNVNAEDLRYRSFLTFVAAWLIMVIPWPWGQASPILNPASAIKMAISFHSEKPVLFAGEMASSMHLPWYYLIAMFAMTLPITAQLLAACGVCAGLVRMRTQHGSKESFVLLSMLLWAVIPVLIWTLTRSNIYDGMRHFLFVLPAIAFWAAIGVQTNLDWTKEWKLHRVVVGLMVLVVLSPIWSLVKLHPYQMTYFNPLVGGLAGAEGEYETDYWATSFKAAAEWLNEQQAKSDKPLQVLVVANKWNRLCIEHYLDKKIAITLVEDLAPQSEDIPVELAYQEYPGIFPQEYNYFVASYRANQSRYYPESPVVHTIGRDEAAFTVIKSQPRH